MLVGQIWLESKGWLRRIAMQPIRLRASITGFIVNRLQFAILREALSLVEAGIVTAAEVDAVMEQAPGPRWAASGPLLSVLTASRLFG